MSCIMKLENEHLVVKIREDCSVLIRDVRSPASDFVAFGSRHHTHSRTPDNASFPDSSTR